MEKRLDAMLQTVKIIRPALEAFYATLSDEQKMLLPAGCASGENSGSAVCHASQSARRRSCDLKERPRSPVPAGRCPDRELTDFPP